LFEQFSAAHEELLVVCEGILQLLLPVLRTSFANADLVPMNIHKVIHVVSQIKKLLVWVVHFERIEYDTKDRCPAWLVHLEAIRDVPLANRAIAHTALLLRQEVCLL